MNKVQGRFIAFEGPEGGGKSTHVARLAEELRRRGLEVVTTREPGGTELAENIRALLQNVREDAPVPRAEVLLFLASRAQHVAKVIAPALARGAWVLTDRFEDSTFAYQGAGRGFALDGLRRLNDFATGGVRPDLVLVMDVSRRESKARLAARQAAAGTDADRIEREADAFHERLRKEFLALAAADPERYAVVDSERPEGQVGREILSVVEGRFGTGMAGGAG